MGSKALADPNQAQWPINKQVAFVLACGAALASLIALLSWILPFPLLRGFGVPGRPIWPLTALGYVCLSTGFLTAIYGRLKVARIAWGCAIAIAVVALFQNLSGINLGVDLIFFRETVLSYDYPIPGRPGPTGAAIFLMLGGGAYISISKRSRSTDAAGLVTSGVLGLAAACSILLMVALPYDPLSKIYGLSLPSALIAVALLGAFALWQSGFGWVRLLGSTRMDSPLKQTLIPFALLLPLLPAILGVSIEEARLMPSIGVKLVVLITNIILVGLIAYWAVNRVTHDREMLIETLDALRESETRLATAIAAADLSVFEYDIETRRFSWLEGSEERLGFPTGAIPDFDALETLVDPDDFEQNVRELRASARAKVTKVDYRYRITTPSGETRMLEGLGRPFYDENGKTLRFVGILLNVTKQEERENALRRREAQLRSILDTVPDAMIVFDEKGKVLQFSAAAEALWGYPQSEVIGRDFRMLSPSDQHPGNTDRLTGYANGSAGSDTISTIGLGADGRRIPLEIRVGVARVDDKALVTAFARDMSDHLANEARLHQLNTELARASQLGAMGELAADLAHELNQPLSASANFLAAARMLLKRNENVDRIAELLGMANDQTLRAGEIIRRLRAFTARGEVERRAELIAETVREAAESVLTGNRQFDIRVGYEFSPDAQYMLADRIQVQQVLVNLIRNAVDAMRDVDPASRRITIRSRKADDDMIEIEVEDTGPGLPPESLERIFARFNTSKRERGGMGIGLSISRRIIEAHGGELKAENRKEGGASFRFTIPATQAEADA